MYPGKRVELFSKFKCHHFGVVWNGGVSWMFFVTSHLWMFGWQEVICWIQWMSECLVSLFEKYVCGSNTAMSLYGGPSYTVCADFICTYGLKSSMNLVLFRWVIWRETICEWCKKLKQGKPNKNIKQWPSDTTTNNDGVKLHETLIN
jgi:hypothetical protein